MRTLETSVELRQFTVNCLFTSNLQLLNLFQNNSKYFLFSSYFLNCLQALISEHGGLNSNFMFFIFVNIQLPSSFFTKITSCNTNAGEFSGDSAKLDGNCISKSNSYGSTSYNFSSIQG